MTSYANDTTATAAAATTTTEGAATNAGAVTPVAPLAATTPATAVGAAAKQVSSNNSNNNGEYNEDDNNSLDGREKADTTPENLKKIAEIINDKEAAAATSGSLSPRLQHQQLHTLSFVGLGAAIDESNTKFCLGKPPPSPAEKGKRIEKESQLTSASTST